MCSTNALGFTCSEYLVQLVEVYIYIKGGGRRPLTWSGIAVKAILKWMDVVGVPGFNICHLMAKVVQLLHGEVNALARICVLRS